MDGHTWDTLEEYLRRTADARNNIESLFITCTRPARAAAPATISNSISHVLSSVGINIPSRALRSIAASTAESQGVPIDMVLGMGNWSSKQVYQRYYQRGVEHRTRHAQLGNLVITTTLCHQSPHQASHSSLTRPKSNCSTNEERSENKVCPRFDERKEMRSEAIHPPSHTSMNNSMSTTGRQVSQSKWPREEKGGTGVGRQL